MKKLTAGILATLIGLVSANSADASVASTNYVKGALAGKQDTLNEGTTVTTTTTQGQEAKVVKSVTAEDGAVAIELGQLDYYDLLNAPVVPDLTNMDFSATDTTGVVQTVTQDDGAVVATYGLVGTADIEDSAVTTGKIADDAVTTEKIADNAVTSTQIVDSTIVDADINDAANIALSKIALPSDTDVMAGELLQVDENNTDYPNAASYSLIKYVDAMGNVSYKWELIDRVYTE